MRFEKLNENKIRITLSHQDLAQKDIDFHSFMSDSIDSQSLFLDVLDKAEREIGFVTKNYQIRIEALAVSGGDFVLTVTRSLPEPITKVSPMRRKVRVKKKKAEHELANLVYSFSNFDDFCSFTQFFSYNNLPVSNIAKNIILYKCNNTYYLVFKEVNLNYQYLKRLCSCITEFGSYISHPDLFMSKLLENGKVIMKHNAIKTAIKYFIHK